MKSFRPVYQHESSARLSRVASTVRQHWVMYLLALPTLVLIGVFQYFPAFSGIYHSVFRWNGADIKEYVGLENFVSLAANPRFWASFNLAFTLGVINIFKMIPAVVIAVCIHRCRSEIVGFVYRVLLVVPMVVPPLVIALIWRAFFFETSTGLLNAWLDVSGVHGFLVWVDSNVFGWGAFRADVRPAWLGDPKLVILALVLWGFPWVGSFAVLVHLAKLRQIPKEIYEAAEIDGVSWFGKFSHIELPLIMGSIQLLLVFVIVDTLKDAGMVLALTNIYGGPGGVATVPALFMLQRAFIDQQFGAACATGLVLTVIVLALQKVSDLYLSRDLIPAGLRRVLDGVVLLTGVYLLVSGAAAVPGLFLVTLSLPWRHAWEAAVWVRNRCWASGSSGAFPRASAVPQAPSRLATELPRVAKHVTILAVLLAAYLPVWLMLVVSFKTNIQFYAAPLVPTAPLHPENWHSAFTAIMPSVANTLAVAATATCLIVVLGSMSAYFFARRPMPLSVVLWNVLLILMMMPTIANLIPLFRLLGTLGLLNTLSGLIIVGVSGGVVFATFVLRNFIADVPKDLFEAAEIDGAGHLRQLFLIVLPLSGAACGTVAVMQFIAIWNDFMLPLIVIRDADRLPVMVQLLRMAGEYIKLWGPLMAGYMLASLPVIVLFALSMRLFVRGVNDGAVKG